VVQVLALLVVVLALGLAASIAVRVRAARGLSPEELAEAQLAELRRALARLDWEVPVATTLLALERRLGRFAGPASASYAAGLRAHRYDPRAPAAPGAAARRAARRDLGARGGIRRRLRALLAMPPGGPRPTGVATQGSRPQGHRAPQPAAGRRPAAAHERSDERPWPGAHQHEPIRPRAAGTGRR
jgi:hypothetical protein